MASRCTPKMEAFAVKYVECGNATESYRFAYSASKMKPETVNRAAFDCLENSKIAARIKELQAEVVEELLISPDGVLKEYARIGFSDVRKLFKEDGRLKDIHTLDDDTAAAVSSVKVVTKNLGKGDVEYVYEMKLWPKNPALESLGKNLGLFEKHNKQKNSSNLDAPLDELIAELQTLRGDV